MSLLVKKEFLQDFLFSPESEALPARDINSDDYDSHTAIVPVKAAQRMIVFAV